MLAEKLINTLEKLLKLHQNLYEVTLQKTDYLKSNDVEKLKELLKKEQMFVQAIKQIEAERIKLTPEFLGDKADMTLSACAEKAQGEHKEKLIQLAHLFPVVVKKIKDANQLNRELTQQALQFVELSLDLFIPQESLTNYNHPNGNDKFQPNKRRSIFDSQA